MKKSNAYVTLLMLSDSYLPGVMVLGYQLRLLDPNTPRICMVTDHISKHAIAVLEVFFDDVIPVPLWHIGHKAAHRHDWSWLFTKLECLRLTQYEKVLLIDADILPLRDYRGLFDLKAPAGILNECKAHFVEPSKRQPGQLLWHDAYGDLCPHGAPIPSYITERVLEDPSNLGVNSCLWLMAPSDTTYRALKSRIECEAVQRQIRQYPLPEMQYMTHYWSGHWSNIDIAYAAFNAQPSLDRVRGTHFAGLKPWQWQCGKSFRHYRRLPDYQLWLRLFREAYGSLPGPLQRIKRLRHILDHAVAD